MSLLRLTQNFCQRRALFVSRDERGTASLPSTLQKLGLSVEIVPPACDAKAALQDLSAGNDVVFVDGDLGEPLSFTGDLPPCPVVGLVGAEAPSRLRGLMQAGATAFLSKPVYGGAVFSALYLAVNEFDRKAALHALLREHEHRRSLRRHVIKAVTLVMRDHDLDDEGAFALLRKQSMSARVSLETYCQYVVQRSATEPRPDPVRMARQAGAE
jgi:AmiR/NasT family two-component response regulator